MFHASLDLLMATVDQLHFPPIELVLFVAKVPIFSPPLNERACVFEPREMSHHDGIDRIRRDSTDPT